MTEVDQVQSPIVVPRDQVDDHFERYVVPTAGKVYWDGVISGGAGNITWDSKIRAPLLLIGQPGQP